MELGKIIAAHNVLKNLPDNDIFTEQNHFDIFMLIKSMQPHIEFAEKRAEEIRGRYSEFEDENGNIVGDPAVKLMREIDTLYRSDINAEFVPIDLPFVKGVNYKVMCDLDGFVNFHMA